MGAEINNGKDLVRLIGSNGITLDREGRIVFASHGDRDVVGIEKDGKRIVLADCYENSAQRSITKTSTGAFADSKRRPSCS